MYYQPSLALTDAAEFYSSVYFLRHGRRVRLVMVTRLQAIGHQAVPSRGRDLYRYSERVANVIGLELTRCLLCHCSSSCDSHGIRLVYKFPATSYFIVRARYNIQVISVTCRGCWLWRRWDVQHKPILVGD